MVDILAGLRPFSPSTSYFGSTHSLIGEKEPKLVLKMSADADRFHTTTGQVTGHKQNWYWKLFCRHAEGFVPKLISTDINTIMQGLKRVYFLPKSGYLAIFWYKTLH